MNATDKTWTVNAIRDAMNERGSCWWDRSSMKFFGTRVLPNVYQGVGGVYFVTSEQPPHGERGFVVREFVPATCDIKTHGDLASMTRTEAVREANRLAGEKRTEIVEPLDGQDAAPVSHLDLIARMLAKCAAGDQWAQRHARAWKNGKGGSWGHGSALVLMIEGAAQYADMHRSSFESGIGEDGALGDEWAAIVKAARSLLNGEIGELDAGTVDRLLCDMLRAEHIDPEA
jgi:hypothetical protein